jgi:hypothetical protein
MFLQRKGRLKNTETLFFGGESIIHGFFLFTGGLGTEPLQKVRDGCIFSD